MRELELSYHKEVMESNHKVIVVRAARRTGKTTLAIKWALKKKGNTLFVVPTSTQASLIQNMLIYYLGFAVMRKEQGFITTTDGREYRIVSTIKDDTAFSGLRVDNIIVDEFGFIDKDLMALVSSKKVSANGDILMLTSSVHGGSIGEFFENFNPFVHRIAYSGLDAVRESLFEESFLAEMKDLLHYDHFTEEFGPWNGFWGESNNAGFVHLLNK